MGSTLLGLPDFWVAWGKRRRHRHLVARWAALGKPRAFSEPRRRLGSGQHPAYLSGLAQGLREGVCRGACGTRPRPPPTCGEVRLPCSA